MNNTIRRVWNMYSMVNIEDLRGTAFQAEDGGHTFEITGVDAGGNETPIAGTVAAVFIRPDNTDVAITGSVSDGKVYVTLTDECYGYPGRFGLTVFLTSDGQKVAIYAAIGSVYRTTSGSVSPETAESVVDLINEIEAAIAQIPASYTDIMSAVAPTYSNTAVYPYGAYAWNEGKLYRCITPINSGETWTPGHWTLATMGGDVADMKSALNGNYMPLSYYSPDGYERYGITFTINADMSVSASGTASSASYFHLVHETEGRTLKAGSYNFSGIKQEDLTNAALFIKVGSTIYTIGEAGQCAFTLSEETAYSSGLIIKQGKTVSGLTIYPSLYFYNSANLNYHPAYERNDELFKTLDENVYKNEKILSDNSDLDDLTTNGVYQAVSGDHSPSNNPFGTHSCTVIVNQFSGTAYVNQLAVEWRSGRTAYRYRASNVWNNWTYSGATRNSEGKYFAFGDSTTYGYSSDHNHAQSPWNYPAIVGKLIDAEVNNCAVPGQGLLKDWNVTEMESPTIVSRIEQMIENGDFDDAVLITVGWAYNDANYYSTVNFGNPSDPIPESTTGITTWLGYYAKVLDMLQKAAPKALVVLITGFGYTTNTEGHKTDQQFTNSRTFKDGSKTFKEMYDAQEAMANYYGYPCINQAKGSAINRANGSYIIGDNIHPTYDNYRLYGNFIAARITSVFQNI